jgi:hypothetical protein
MDLLGRSLGGRGGEMNPERFMVNEAEERHRIQNERRVIEAQIKIRLRELYALGLDSEKVAEILTYLHDDVAQEFEK